MFSVEMEEERSLRLPPVGEPVSGSLSANMKEVIGGCKLFNYGTEISVGEGERVGLQSVRWYCACAEIFSTFPGMSGSFISTPRCWRPWIISHSFTS